MNNSAAISGLTPMVSIPSEGTLKKYGLSAEEWLAILERQGGVCPICGLMPKTGRFVTDHDHVKNWKKLPPEERKLYVRGVTCWFCNSVYLGRGITVERARRVVQYLLDYAAGKIRETILGVSKHEDGSSRGSTVGVQPGSDAGQVRAQPGGRQ